MGNIGSATAIGVTDLFYPSNPKLRRRAEELAADCKVLVSEFEKKTADFEKLDASLQQNINAFLSKQGYDSFDELRSEVESFLTGPALARYESLLETINVTKSIDEAVSSIALFAEAAGIATVGALVIAGVLSGPAGWAAIGGIGVAASIVAMMGLLAAAIVGKIVQEKLKDSIEDLFHARGELQLQVNRLGVLVDFMNHMLVYIGMTDDEQLQNYEAVWGRIQMVVADRWDIERAHKMLKDKDNFRGSYQGADPKPRGAEYFKLVTHARNGAGRPMAVSGPGKGASQKGEQLWKGEYDVLSADGGLSKILEAAGKSPAFGSNKRGGLASLNKIPLPVIIHG